MRYLSMTKGFTRGALATRHSNQCEIQQKQVLLTVPAACFPKFRQLQIGDYWAE